MGDAKITPEGTSSRTLRSDLHRVLRELSHLTDEAQTFIRHNVEAYPLMATGAAAGAGFLVGGGLTRHGLALVLGVGARMAAGFLSDELAGVFEHRPSNGATQPFQWRNT